MEPVQHAFDALDNLCRSIKSFAQSGQQSATYRAPIIDHFHPDDYCQKTIAGLSRFSSHCQSERDYVEGVSPPQYLGVIMLIIRYSSLELQSMILRPTRPIYWLFGMNSSIPLDLYF